MKILLIEDEAPAARRLQKMLREIDPAFEIVGTIESVESGISWFGANPAPDLVISDIQLSDNLSFEIFRACKTEAPIIFTTAFDQYAIQAFEHMSIDYLLKPLRPEKLEKAIDKLKTMKYPQTQFDAGAVIDLIQRRNYRERILVYSGDSLISVPADDIAYLCSENGTSFLVSRTSKRYILSESLDRLENTFDPRKFFRANRQFIVNIHSITRVAPWFNQKLLIELNPPATDEVIVSKLKATEFKKWMNA